MTQDISRYLTDSAQNLLKLSQSSSVVQQIEKAIEMLVQSLERGGTLYLCGNGGSAGDAQNFATELMVKLSRNRNPIRALALSVDSSVLTAVGNDFDYSQVFARQVEGLGRPGDVLLAISTSGKSPNVIEALKMARSKNLKTILLSGFQGGPAFSFADHAILASGENTGQIQESHIVIYHVICTLLEKALVEKKLISYRD